MDGKTLTGKLLSDHLVSGSLEAGEECRIRVDSTLVHDMSGLLAFIGFVFTLCWSLFGSAFKLLFSKYAKITNSIMALLLVYCAVSLFLS